MVPITVISDAIKTQLDKDLVLHAVYRLDADNRFLIAVKNKNAKDDRDLMDPYYMYNSTSNKITPFIPFNNMQKFKKALENRIK